MPVLEWILASRRWVLLAFWALFLASIPGLLRVEIDNSPEAFFVQDALELARYRQFTDDFGNPEVARVVVKGPEVWTPNGLVWLRRLERDLPAQPGILGAAGLWGHHRSRFPEWPPPEAELFRGQVTANVLDRNAGWVSADGSTVTVLLALQSSGSAEREELLERISALLTAAPVGIETNLVGLPVINTALDEAFVKGAFLLLPPLLALAVALMIWLLRSAVEVAMPLVVAVMCEVILFGCVGYAGAAFGSTLNVVSMVLGPLIFALALATTLHVLLRFRAYRQRGFEIEAAIVATYRDKAWPVFWTGLTTGVGFGSLAVSNLPPVRATGIWLALGITLLTVAVLTLFPALLREFVGTREVPAARSFEQSSSRWGRGFAEFAVRHRAGVFTVFAAVFLVAVLGGLQLEVESNVLAYFRSDHPVRRDLEELQDRGLGAIPVDLILDFGKKAVERSPRARPRLRTDFRQADALDGLAELTDKLRQDPLVLGAVSLADLRQSPAGEAVSETVADGFLDTGRAMLEAREGTSTRIALLVPMLGISSMGRLFESAEELARSSFSEAEVWLTGRYPLVIEAQRTLIWTLVVSLSLTLLCVASAFRWILGSGRLTMLALMVNLWPVALVLGAMGWLGVSLEGPTVMVAAVALGLAVDDTLHFVGEFRRLARTRIAALAVVATQGRIAGAQLLSSLVLATGFGACALSSFIPVARFAALMVLAIFMALVADLFLMPALVSGARVSEVGRLRS